MERPWKILSLHCAKRNPAVWNTAFCDALAQRGQHRLVEDAANLSDEDRTAAIREHDILLTAWDAPPLPEALIADPGKLRYVCHINGEIRRLVDRRFIEAGFLITNWGPAPARRIAEGAVALLLASLKQIPQHVLLKRGSKWEHPDRGWSGSLQGLRVGLYGLGVIGKECARLLEGFGTRLIAFDPYAPEGPAGVDRVDSLADLFSLSAAVIIAAGLNDETRQSIGNELLAKLPDGGIIVNVARGGILDQEALLAEVRQGRLRAALDVLDTNGQDWMPPDNPDRLLPNLILTGHTIGAASWNDALSGAGLSEAHSICLSNIDRFCAGESPLYAFDIIRYDRST